MKKLKLKLCLWLAIGAATCNSCSKDDSSSDNSSSNPSSSTTTIGNQVWMNKNLEVDHYRNGDPIIQAQSENQLTSMTTGGWCYYLFNSSNGPVYGKLYNWYAVNDPRGIAPLGYHIPTKTELYTLSQTLGAGAGGLMKETGTAHWTSPNTGATNASGFNALPGGGCTVASGFGGIGSEAAFWTLTPSSTVPAEAEFYLMSYDSAQLVGDIDFKTSFYSVRCVKD
jgi:uncharacterized protein (TIGR02145 family)